MPLAKGSSRRAIGHNIKAELEAGMDQPQAVAIALRQARKSAKRRAKYGYVKGENRVELNEVLAPGLPPWYEAVWHVKGHERARRRAEGPKLGPVKKAFDRFVREIQEASGGGGARAAHSAKSTGVKKPGKCIWCSRSAGACWTMPCLDLETALANEDDRAMKRWARGAGVGIQKRGRTL